VGVTFRNYNSINTKRLLVLLLFFLDLKVLAQVIKKKEKTKQTVGSISSSSAGGFCACEAACAAAYNLNQRNNKQVTRMVKK
jgi:mevalonate pyrophosphate decarboxylase